MRHRFTREWNKSLAHFLACYALGELPTTRHLDCIVLLLRIVCKDVRTYLHWWSWFWGPVARGPFCLGQKAVGCWAVLAVGPGGWGPVGGWGAEEGLLGVASPPDGSPLLQSPGSSSCLAAPLWLECRLWSKGQVRSLTKFYSVDFSQLRIGVKKVRF